MRPRRLRGHRSGFALLLVFAMAAVVAIMLYNELPSVAFEAQRLQEQLLIDRGEQYERAITLYVRKNNRFPPDLDALDKTAGQRFLRRRFKDPMTGKDEWRLVHVGPGGVFTDSLVYNKKKSDADKSGPQNFITELQQIGGPVTDPSTQAGNIAARHRPSDAGGAPGTDPGNLQYSSGAIPNGAAGGLQNGIPNGIPNGVTSGIPNGLSNGIPNGFNATGQPLTNGQLPNAGTQAGLPPGIQFPNGAQTAQNYGQAPVQAGSAATNMINQLLTTPRPNPFNAASGATSGTASGASVDQFGNPLPATGNTAAGPGGTTPAPMQGQNIGGGLAGVASKMEREGIKVYRDRTAYNEWEFVYDVTQDKSRQGTGGAVTPNAAPGGSGASPSSAPASNGLGSQPGNVFPQPVAQPSPQPFVPPTISTGVAPGGTLGAAPAAPVSSPPSPPVAVDPSTNPSYPIGIGQPGLPTAPGASGAPGSAPAPTTPQPTVPGGIVPGAPIGGGIVPSAPIGGATPH